MLSNREMRLLLSNLGQKSAAEISRGTPVPLCTYHYFALFTLKAVRYLQRSLPLVFFSFFVKLLVEKFETGGTEKGLEYKYSSFCKYARRQHLI